MKKAILPLLIIGTIGVSGYFFGFDTLFTPGAVKKVRADRVEVLEKEATEAEKRFRAHLESAEKAGNAYEKLGKKLLERKEWTPAIESLTKAIGYGAGGARAHYLLGAAYANRAMELASRKDTDKALHHYNRALEINSNLHDAAFGIAMIYYYIKKDSKEALERLEKIARKEPDFFSARFSIGTIYYAEGNYPRALSVYENLYRDLSQKPDSPVIEQMRNKCKENISLIQVKISR